MDLLEKLAGKQVTGAGMDYGAMHLFFKDGTMLTVKVERAQYEDHTKATIPTGDIVASLTEYERELPPQELAIDVFVKTHPDAYEITPDTDTRIFEDGQGRTWEFFNDGAIKEVV